MSLTILPLRAILSESLILLVAIAIESWFFQLKLNFTPKASVEYATVMNLISSCIKWVLFFFAVSMLTNTLEQKIVAYILFGKIGPIYPIFILFIFLFFLISLIIKLVSFNLCDSLWGAGMKISQAWRKLRTPNSIVIIVAHICSYLVICLNLLLQRYELS